MKNWYRIPICAIILLVLFCSSAPVQAFTSDALSVEILSDGDAFITFAYSLNTLENAAVYFKIAEPEKELKKALEDMFHHPVSVDEVNDGSAKFLVRDFAKIPEVNGTKTVHTPLISFKQAEKALNKYWFAPLVQADYSAAVASITYPDGSREEFSDAIEIPATKHTLSR